VSIQASLSRVRPQTAILLGSHEQHLISRSYLPRITPEFQPGDIEKICSVFHPCPSTNLQLEISSSESRRFRVASMKKTSAGLSMLTVNPSVASLSVVSESNDVIDFRRRGLQEDHLLQSNNPMFDTGRNRPNCPRR